MRTDETSRNSYGHVLRIFLVILRQRKGRRASHVCIKMTNEAESSSIYQHLCIHLYNMNDANINVVYIYMNCIYIYIIRPVQCVSFFLLKSHHTSSDSRSRP